MGLILSVGDGRMLVNDSMETEAAWNVLKNSAHKIHDMLDGRRVGRILA